ncbi:MAG: adenylate/guanylate cyclase domain-containing protein [Candidatus Tectimicrobiota bacterium]
MAFTFQIRNSASQDRLEKLIEARLQPGANKADIDHRIWDLFGEEWAIMYTDLSGFSRSVEAFGIIHFLQVIYESHKLLVPCIDQHDGILLKIEADSMLVIFRNVRKAIDCAVSMQQATKDYNYDKEDTEKIFLCVGLGFGKVLRIGDEDVFGAEVNAACKLGEDLARAWEILVTDAVFDVARDRPQVEFVCLDATPSGASGAYKMYYTLD